MDQKNLGQAMCGEVWYALTKIEQAKIHAADPKDVEAIISSIAKREGVLHKMLENNKLGNVPQFLLTKENVLEASVKSMAPLIHRAAKAGQLLLLPKEFLKEENLQSLDTNGANVFHKLAVKGSRWS